MKKEKYIVTGMTCGACSSRVEKAVKKLDGVGHVQVNLLTGSMMLERDESLLGESDIEEAVSKAGYSAALSVKGKNLNQGGETSTNSELGIKVQESGTAGGGAEPGIGQIHRQEAEKKGIIFKLSLLFLLPMMYFSMGPMLVSMLGLPFDIPTGLPLANTLSQFILLIPIIYLNRDYFIKGIPALFRGNPNMDSLIAISAAVSTAYGIFAMYQMIYGNMSHDIYLESAGMILTLITMGKYLEARSKGKTTDAIEKLMNLAPKTVIIESNGVEKQIPVEDLKVGDILIVKPGQTIGADGTVISGESWVEQSAITGESIPVPKKAGDEVISATINQNGLLRVRAEKVGENSTINQIINLVNEASASKAPIAQMADKVAGIFVPAIIAISIITFVLWMIFDGDLSMAINCAVSVLVISCPCALGLATPVAIMVGTGKGAEGGILIKSGEALETLHAINTVLMDKTGTITEGKPKVTDIVPVDIKDDELLLIAAALEKGSEHPLGEAIISEQNKRLPNVNLPAVENFEAVFGKGVKGNIGGRLYFGGNMALMDDMKVEIPSSVAEQIHGLSDQGKTPMIFAEENGQKVIGIIAVADVPKSDSRASISAFEKSGVEVVMLTGDNSRTGEAMAQALGIDRVISEVMPQDKEAEVKKLQDAGKKVAMIGDGINDGPALARADVGIAIGAGTDVAIESADVVLINNRLTDAFGAFKLSNAVIRNIKENLFWAFFYNVILIPVAAGILYPIWGIVLNPMMGAAAMSLSSFCVVMNSLRLRFFNKGENISENLTNTKDMNIIDEEINATNEEFEETKQMNKYDLKVRGMMCGNCVKHVEKALSSMNGVKSVSVDLDNAAATVESSVEITMDEFKKVIEEAGYELV